MEIPEHFHALSIRMSDSLDDSGAGKDTVMERRKTYLWRELMEMIINRLMGSNTECFHFGSQSEGTTTPGLQSDIDVLVSNVKVNIMTVWGDWKFGIANLLMIHDDTTPPQQYLLQAIRYNTPEPETSLCDNMVFKDSGQVLLSSERRQQQFQIEYESKNYGMTTKNGPSVSWRTNWDIVQAFHVLKPLPEIQYWIDKCRGRHWPSSQLLEAARVAPCFLIPAGHTDSDYKREEWRLSPNLIERMLMFSFKMTQIKCYIVLKQIKKSLFAKFVGDCITTFHCKTIMFYTMERTRPSMWLEHNLMFLLWLCLHVFRRFLRLGRLPHYIIEGVNLFDGKLSKVQQRRLLVYIDSMIRSNLNDVLYIDIDNIGCRLQACSIRRIAQAGEQRERVCLRNSISLLLKFECLEEFVKGQSVLFNRTFKEKDLHYQLRNCVDYMHSTNVRLKSVAIEFIKHLYGRQNSIQLSNCLRLQNVVNSELIRHLQFSLNTDLASSHLKLASVLYCSGYIHAAVRVLEDVEMKFHSKVKAVCGYRLRKDDRDLQMFANMLPGSIDNGFSEPLFAFCVKFARQESYCTPFILLFEMNRTITEEEVSQRIYIEKQWMDCAEVDSRPFLHYLQYLTYGGLGERDNQLHALEELLHYIFDKINDTNLYHPETAVNLLGHCFEMEGKYKLALDLYTLSLRNVVTNNAANWHVRRILRLING